MLEPIVIDTETTSKNPHKAGLLAVGVRSSEAISLFDGNTVPHGFLNAPVIGHNIKYDAVVLRHNLGVKLAIADDTMIMQYVLDPSLPRGLKELFPHYFGEPMLSLVEEYNEHERSIDPNHKDRVNLPENWFKGFPVNKLKSYLTTDLTNTHKLHALLEAKLKEKPEVYAWYKEVEVPMCEVLIETEARGVRIDRDKLAGLGVRFKEEAERLEHQLVQIAGDSNFNVNSGKQLQELLFNKFKLPKTKKTKTGYSTDADVIEKLAETDYFCKLLLEFRTLDKLCGTYVEPILSMLDDNDRLRCQFNQCLTKTRRLSCNTPNLQNIPVKTEFGQMVKDCFVPDEGCKFLVADWSQIELRVLAHESKDKNLLDAFLSGVDVHERTAALMGCSRDRGKKLNFELIYGKSAYGFAQDWNVSEKEAEEIIKTYYKALPGVCNWMVEARIRAKASNGYVKSLSGLPLFVDGVHSNVRAVFNGAMRAAVNYPIQGSAADIMKKAAVNIYKKFGIAPNLLVHDEFVFNLKDDKHIETRAKEIIDEMESAWQLDVPLKVTWHLKDRWSK